MVLTFCTSVILADNFRLDKGEVEIVVPWVKTRNDYSLVCTSEIHQSWVPLLTFLTIVFGNSGNHSPKFSIINTHRSIMTPATHPSENHDDNDFPSFDVQSLLIQ